MRRRAGQLTEEPIEQGIDMGPATDRISLVLYGTGIRDNQGAPAVSVNVGGVNAPVVSAGADERVPGLDRVVVNLPRVLAQRRGDLAVRLRVEEPSASRVLESNVVEIRINGGEDDSPGGGDCPDDRRRRC